MELHLFQDESPLWSRLQLVTGQGQTSRSYWSCAGLSHLDKTSTPSWTAAPHNDQTVAGFMWYLPSKSNSSGQNMSVPKEILIFNLFRRHLQQDVSLWIKQPASKSSNIPLKAMQAESSMSMPHPKLINVNPTCRGSPGGSLILYCISLEDAAITANVSGMNDLPHNMSYHFLIKLSLQLH